MSSWFVSQSLLFFWFVIGIVIGVFRRCITVILRRGIRRTGLGRIVIPTLGRGVRGAVLGRIIIPSLRRGVRGAVLRRVIIATLGVVRGAILRRVIIPSLRRSVRGATLRRVIITTLRVIWGAARTADNTPTSYSLRRCCGRQKSGTAARSRGKCSIADIPQRCRDGTTGKAYTA